MNCKYPNPEEIRQLLHRESIQQRNNIKAAVVKVFIYICIR